MFMKNRHGPISRILFIIGTMGLFVVGYYWGNQHQRSGAETPRISGVLIRPARALPDFDLVNPYGEHFNLASFAETLLLLTFADLSQAQGHLAVNRLIQIHNSLAADPQLQRSVRMILVATTDAPTLARDFSQLSPGFDVLSGDPDELMRLQAALGMQGTGADTEVPLFLIGPGSALIALFPRDQPPRDIAADLSAINEAPNTLMRRSVGP